jgi:DNA-nicking Smr family endonuclease
MTGDEGAPDDDAVAIVIDGTLDLHHFSPRDLRTLIPDYLEACLDRGIIHVRLIHGRGIGAVQRSVHALLSRSPHVVSYRLAEAERGGRGATLVDLRPRS